MSSNARQRVVIALSLMMFLLLGSMAAQARDTHGSDRLVKGVAIGAAVGAITQMVRGRTEGTEVLKGAAVGGAVGAAVGAYSDYKQEKNARYDDRRRDDYYESRSYNRRGTYRGDHGDYNANARQGRGHRAARHNRCR